MQSPALGRVPTRGSTDELLIKATSTGITLLAKYNPDKKKYVETGPTYGNRYTGSKSHAVDINGNLWMSAKNLEEEKKEAYRRFKNLPDKKKGQKKSSKEAPLPLKENVIKTPAISEELPVSAKKTRKKEYTVNGPQVRQRIHAYINTVKGRKQLYFWTISFPEGTPDKLCYQIFNIWLTSLRKYRMLHDYLWVVERQDGKRITQPGKLPTNTIHFHMAVPHYLDVNKANSMMRGTLKGFAARGEMPGAVVDRKTRKIIYLNSIANYNGVDIAKHKKTGRVINFAVKKGARALASYLTKYVTKNEEKFEHLAWHNSRGYSGLFTGVTFSFKEFNAMRFAHFLNPVRNFEMNYATFIPWMYGMPPVVSDHLFQLNSGVQRFVDAGEEDAVIKWPAGPQRHINTSPNPLTLFYYECKS